MWFVSRSTLLKGLSELSINLASGWLGVVLIAPGFMNASPSKYFELLTGNLAPGIIVFVIGLFLLENSKKNHEY